MKINTTYLYDLLPAYYRVIDNEQGEPLKALIEILAREGRIVEDNIDQLYENWFIETCDEWVVPYIGDLLGVRGIHEVNDAAVYSRRAYVANTLSYRRRKGTAPILEQLALDVTGWRARVVEFFQLLATTQNLNHLRLHSTTTPDLRKMNTLDLINTAFDTQSHTVEVRRIEPQLGKYNISNIGLYLWRLQSYPLNRVEARKKDTQTGCYTFSPLGLDTHLFNKPQTESDIVHLAEEINVPGLLRRQNLHDELEDARQSIVNEQLPDYTYFNEDYPPVFELFINDNKTPLARDKITICNLSKCQLAPEKKAYKKSLDDGNIIDAELAITAAVDPVLGRISFSDPSSITKVIVNYNYGFSGDIGGGPYDRLSSLRELTTETIDWHVGVSIDHNKIGTEDVYDTLGKAIDAWNGLDFKQVGLITIMDNRTYKEDLIGPLSIEIPEGKRLYIIAADWPKINLPGAGSGIKYRKTGMFHPEDLRPHILGDIEVIGTAAPSSLSGGSLILNGLLIEGKINILTGNLNACSIQHSTLVPYMGGLEVAAQARIIAISLQQSISGPIKVLAEKAQLKLENAIIDHQEGYAISILEGQLAINECTVFGRVEAQALDASNSIFNDLLEIYRRQIGCVRFSYLPINSVSPRRYRCQPDLEIQAKIKERQEQDSVPLSDTERQTIRNRVLSWLFPVFNANVYGHHAYGQLGSATPLQLTTGADNASEMGVFNYLQQPQREANLRIVLEEYLRLGLESGIIYVT